jgi:hypothetical protein
MIFSLLFCSLRLQTAPLFSLCNCVLSHCFILPLRHVFVVSFIRLCLSIRCFFPASLVLRVVLTFRFLSGVFVFIAYPAIHSRRILRFLHPSFFTSISRPNFPAVPFVALLSLYTSFFSTFSTAASSSLCTSHSFPRLSLPRLYRHSLSSLLLTVIPLIRLAALASSPYSCSFMSLCRFIPHLLLMLFPHSLSSDWFRIHFRVSRRRRIVVFLPPHFPPLFAGCLAWDSRSSSVFGFRPFASSDILSAFVLRLILFPSSSRYLVTLILCFVVSSRILSRLRPRTLPPSL